MSGIVPAPIARQPWQMLFPLFTLIGFGALVLFSAAAGSWDPYASSHLLRFGVFLVMAFVLSLFPRDFIQFMALPVYVVVLLMLLAVEAIGFVGGGSQRWLNLGFMQLQPSELMKPAVVLILARYYASLPVGMIPTWSALIAPGAMILTPVALVLLQPDLGTSLAIVFGGAMVMFAAGLPLRWFVGAAAAGAVLAPVAFHRILFRRRQRPWLVEAGNVFARAGLGMLALTSAGAVLLVFDVVVGRPWSYAAGLSTLGLFLAVWLALPLLRGGPPPDRD